MSAAAGSPPALALAIVHGVPVAIAPHRGRVVPARVDAGYGVGRPAPGLSSLGGRKALLWPSMSIPASPQTAGRVRKRPSARALGAVPTPTCAIATAAGPVTIGRRERRLLLWFSGDAAGASWGSRDG